jgi:2-haloacid dehalogenase
MRRYDAVVFDLLTALIDSWTLWNDVAGSPERGLAWRKCYLEITYGCGPYRPYDVLVAEAAQAAGLPRTLAAELDARWSELRPWDGVQAVLAALAHDVPLAVATNCSRRLGQRAADLTGGRFAVVMTAEDCGFYKPRPEPYAAVLAALGTKPARTLFVAGSASDVPGAMGVGMPVVWHNRIGLPRPAGASPPMHEIDRLDPVVSLVRG